MEDSFISDKQKKRVQELTDTELKNVIINRTEYQPEFIALAKEEALKRNLIDENFRLLINVDSENNSSAISNSNIPSQNEDIDEWYYERKGKRIGPVSIYKLRSLIAEEKVYKDTLIWKKGFTDWKKISETELQYLFVVDSETPPPLAPGKINNTFVWILAFVPIIGSLIELIYSMNGTPLKERTSQILFLSLNVAFAIIDDIKLKNAGYRTKNLGWAIFFVPVYLWRRATFTKQKRFYFWAWILSFVFLFLIYGFSEGLFDSYGTKKEFGKIELYYTDNINESTANTLGNYLEETEYGSGNEAAVQIDKKNGKYLFRAIFEKGSEYDQSLCEALKSYATQLSVFIFNSEPVEVQICDENFETVKTLQMDPIDNKFYLNTEVTFSGVFSLEVVDFTDNYSALVTDANHKLICVEVKIKNTSKGIIDYNALDFSVLDENGYSYNTDFDLIINGKTPSLNSGTLNKDSYIRGWITFKVPKKSNEFTLHFYDTIQQYTTDIILKKSPSS